LQADALPHISGADCRAEALPHISTSGLAAHDLTNS